MTKVLTFHLERVRLRALVPGDGAVTSGTSNAHLDSVIISAK